MSHNIHGQPRAMAVIKAFLRSPESRAFLLHGPTGTGKTSTAHYLADALQVDRSPVGGFDEIPAGEQSAEAVRQLAMSFRLRPMRGDWRLIVVNECDSMSSQAEKIWLDVLEHLPPRVVICFTTNEPGKLSARFSDRCRAVEYVANARAVQEFIRAQWAALMPGVDAPDTLDQAGFRPGRLPSYRLALSDLQDAIDLASADEEESKGLDARPWIVTDGRIVWGSFRSDEEEEARTMREAMAREMNAPMLLARTAAPLSRGSQLPSSGLTIVS
jgi:hypothetical protein